MHPKICFADTWSRTSPKLSSTTPTVSSCESMVPKFSPVDADGQLKFVLEVTTGGSFRLEGPNVGTSSTSASGKPAASRISTASSSSPVVFGVK
jgi:hypothetical protein